jgi:ubiquinone/menaquinone biosynthesis C-methylase UbiE
VENLEHLFPKNISGSCQVCRADIFDMPFAEDSFDLVWNEGVLEHFEDAGVVRALQEMGRVSRGFVLVDVPYAGAKGYMLSKSWMQAHGQWPWGD